jgi:hypothetical protein
MSGFSLADCGTIDGHPVRGHIFDLQADHIAAAQLVVDGEIEHGQVPGALLHRLGHLSKSRRDILPRTSLRNPHIVVGSRQAYP